MNKKRTLLAGAISSVLAGPALADINDILITEYVEGTDNNKAIEISNLGSVDHVFDDSVGLYYSSYNNLVEKPEGGNVLEGITLPAGQSIVVVNGESGSEMRQFIERLGGEDALVFAGTYDQVKYSALNFNGDDAVWLGTSSAEADIHDLFGTYGAKGNYLWSDKTYRRTTTSPSSTYNESNWDEFETDDFGGLGHPTDVNNDPVDPPSNLVCTDNPDVESKYIGEVQGTGDSSPLITSGYESESTYKVTGVVSAVTTSLVKGFYLYDENADGIEGSSDGILVVTSDADSSLVGQKVCVVAKVKENYGLTQLVPEDGLWEVVDSTPVAVTPVEMKRLSSDTTFESTLERYEGMLVKTVEDMGKTDLEIAAIEELVSAVTVDAVEGESEQDYTDRLEAAQTARRTALMAEKYDLRVSRSFSFDYDAFRNNMVLAYKRPNPQPNQGHVAGSDDSIAQSEENDDFRLILESDQKADNGQIPYYPAFNATPQDNYVRIDDSVIGLTGVIDYAYGDFRMVVPTEDDSADYPAITFSHNTDRTDAPSLNESYGDDGFTIKVATQNVLNYFNSPFGGSDNSFGDNRGADSEQEFERQQAKIVEAIYGLDADILGLMEIENNGFGDFSAINELLAAINAKYDDEDYGDRDEQNSIHNRYVFVGFDKNGDTVLDEYDTVGSDAITSGVIYRPSKVQIAFGKVIPMPEQHAPMIVDENNAPLLDSKGEIRESGDNYQRHTVAATFNVINTGKRLTVAINHLKSKGSTCYEDWVGWEQWEDFDRVKDDVPNEDFQGSCENFRVAAAYHLGNEMDKIDGDKVVLGDMNSYAHEDPMLVLTSNPTNKAIYAAGYTTIDGEKQFGPEGQRITKTFGYLNAVDMFIEEGKTPWSYSYNDEVGSLDHMLISSSLKNRIVDATDWHINAAETSLYDYNNEYKYDTDSNGNPVDQEGNILPEDDSNVFYSETPFRSSDHDSAIISLGYKYGEGGEEPVNIAIKSGRADIAFPVSSDAQAGDIAKISISPKPVGAVLPQVVLTKDNAQTVMFDVVGLDTGEYTINMTLNRESSVSAQSSNATTSEVIDSMSMQAEISKRDSSNVSPVYAEYDGSGGSFGFGALLSLIGLGFLRRRKL